MTTAAESVPACLARLAAAFADRPALAGVEGEPSLDFRTLDHITAGLAGTLAEAGVGSGDAVLMGVADGPGALAALLGITRVGIAVPVPPLEEAERYERIIAAVGAVAVVMEHRPQSTLARVAARAGLTVVVVDRRDVSRVSVERPRPAVTARPPGPEDPALFALTSGATAMPKVVRLSHAAFLCGAQRFAEIAGTGPGDRALVMMPIAHLHSLWRSALPVLLAGGQVIWAPGFDSRNVVGWLRAHGPTYLSGVPSILRRLADLAADMRGLSLARIVIGSDRVSARDVERLRDVFGAEVLQFYGMSETSPCIAIGRDRNDGAVGYVLPDWSVRVVDDDGAEVPSGGVGEIRVHGGHINPVIGPDGTLHDRRDADGWFPTGDVGRLDADGSLTIVGRADDRITRGGQKIAASAVEAAIAPLPEVRNVVAFGVPDPVHGETVAVAIETAAVRDRTLRARVLTAARRALASYMVPEHVVVLPELPLNDIGKVSRRRVVDMVKADPGLLARQTDAAAGVPQELVDAILPLLRAVLRRPDLPADADFFDEDGDSLAAIELLMDIEGRLGVPVSPAEFSLDGSAIGLARIVAGRRGALPSVQLTRMTEPGSLPPVVLANGVAGAEGYASDFAAAIGRDRAVYTFSVNAIDHDDPTPLLDDRAAEYAAMIRDAVPEGPVILAGFSMGAHLALATAQALARAGRRIGPVVVIDDDAEMHKRHFGVWTRPPAGYTPPDHFQRALANSPARPFGGRILYIRAEANAAFYRSDPNSGWAEIAGGGVEYHDLPGNHPDMVRPDNLRRIGDILDRAPLPDAPGDPDPLALMRHETRVAACSGDLARELMLYERLLAIAPDQPAWLHVNHARALFQDRRHREAVAAYEAAIRLDPWPLNTDLQFIRRFTRTAWLADQRDRALARARALVPDHPSVHFQLCRFFELAGDMDAAERHIAEGLALDPGNVKLQRSAASMLSGRGDHAGAAEIYRRMVDRHPELGELHSRLGGALLGCGRIDEAVAVLEAAREVWPKQWRIHLALARAEERRGNRAAAATHAAKVIELHPDSDDARRLAGVAPRPAGEDIGGAALAGE